ncbi:type IV pilin protein [Vibrio sp. B1FLJ16]|uniref:type IV pilin protein n=1 Tax=Vibrio sp. B1FLJ16 TaxID=2751178 RepID=UPI0015F65DA7|nr:type IV pilin protein [Vibrio sp. B1FLJ16]
MIRIYRCNRYNSRLRGMTLIELLIAVVIIGILSAFAYPSYTNHVIKSHRTVALTDLSRIQLELETSYNGGYNWSSIVSGTSCTICDSDSDRFSFSVVSSATMAYTITATAKSDLGQDKDSCFPSGVSTITLNATNVEYPSDCWN